MYDQKFGIFRARFTKNGKLADASKNQWIDESKSY